MYEVLLRYITTEKGEQHQSKARVFDSMTSVYRLMQDEEKAQVGLGLGLGLRLGLGGGASTFLYILYTGAVRFVSCGVLH